MDLRKKITLSGKEGKTQLQEMEVVYRQHAQTVFKYLMLLTHEANLAEELRRADLIVAAIGKPEFVRGDMVKEGAVVIDVGINRVADAGRPKGYRLTGDVAFEEVAPKASAITPVPGGVGPMTIAMLMRNTLRGMERIMEAQ